MTVDQVYIVDELKKKIQLLADKLEAQKSLNIRLQSESRSLENRLEEKEKTIEELKKQNNTLKLSRAFISENGEGPEAKLQINKIVREIDKCIALLNR